MKLTLDKFLECVELDEEIDIYTVFDEYVFSGTVKEFFEGSGYYPYLRGNVQYDFELIHNWYIYSIGAGYKGLDITINNYYTPLR